MPRQSLLATSLPALVLLFTLLHPAFAVGPTEIPSPFTSRKIPVHFIRHWSGDLTTPPSHLLYELSPNGTLYTPNSSIPLLTLAQPLSLNSTSSYTINGARTNPAFDSIQLRKGAGYTVLFNTETRQVVRAWGNKLHLSLPDPQNFPSILVTTSLDTLRHTQTSLSHSIRAQIPSRLHPLLRQRRLCRTDVDHHVEILVAYDNTFCEQNGNDVDVANAYVQAMVNQADQVYRDETCLSLTLSHIDAHCKDPDDPYNLEGLRRRIPLSLLNNLDGDSDVVIFGFRIYWDSNRNRQAIPRDANFLFTNYSPDQRVLGVAFTGAVCTDFHYAWVQNGDLSTFVHEAGHLFSASHTNSGVMSARAMPGAPISFSRTSVNEINNFIDDFRRNEGGFNDTSCVRPSPAPRCDSAVCPGRCFRNQCIVSFEPRDAARGFIPCTPVRSPYFCVTEQSLGNGRRPLSVSQDCPQGFEYLRLRGAQPGALCCNPPTATTTADVILKDNVFFSQRVPGANNRGVFVDVVDDLSLISRGETLMRTTVNPSCGLAGPTPSPSVQPTAGGSDTCSSAFQQGETFRCRRQNLGVAVSSPRRYRVRLTYQQRNGNLSVIAQALGSSRIRAVARTFSTARVTIGDVGAPQILRGPGLRRSVTVGVNGFGLRLRPGVRSCCGATVFIALSIEVCNSRGNACNMLGIERNARMLCRRCRSNQIVLQPSEVRACGECVRQ